MIKGGQMRQMIGITLFRLVRKAFTLPSNPLSEQNKTEDSTHGFSYTQYSCVLDGYDVNVIQCHNDDPGE